jgi:hypothetical protein
VVQITADGYLQGTGEVDLQLDDREAWEGEIILIAQMLLFLFIGEAITLRLVLDLWPGAPLDDGDSGIGRNA